MLEYLKLENVGPAPRMEVEFAPRVNLITGDNGLGKSFLLDAVWRMLTGRWPAEVNRRMTSGLPARPIDRKKPAIIQSRVHGTSGPVESSARYMAAEETWTRTLGPTDTPGVVIYVHADGSLSVWDPARNDWPRWDGGEKHERRPPYVFTEAEVWDGLKGVLDGRPVPLCKGLLEDWSSWIKAGDANADAMREALHALSPDQEQGGVLVPGPPMRLSIDDVRDIPSIQTTYAGAVPILHAAAGVRRVIALAYVVTWAWSEHRIAADLRGEEVVRQVTMLYDEVEGHLHPRWQR